MRTYVVEVDETKPAERFITAGTSIAAQNFVAKSIISVRLATQSDMYEAAKRGIDIEDANAPDNRPIP